MSEEDGSREGRKARISKLAVASVVIPLVLCIGCVCYILAIQSEGFEAFDHYFFLDFAIVYFWPVAFLLGLASLIKIKMSGGLLKGYVFGCAGLLLSVLSFHYGTVALDTIKRQFAIHYCQENMRYLAEDLRSYSNDYGGKYPTPDKWCDLLAKYIEPGENKEWYEDLLLCPTRSEERKSVYAINPKATPKSASDVVLLFETRCDSERCWNRFGGADILTFENHRRVTLVTLLTSLPFTPNSLVGCCNILLNDGSVKLIYPEQLGDLNWGDEGED